MLGDFRDRKYSKTGARTRSILEKFAFDTTRSVLSDSNYVNFKFCVAEKIMTKFIF